MLKEIFFRFLVLKKQTIFDPNISGKMCIIHYLYKISKCKFIYELLILTVITVLHTINFL